MKIYIKNNDKILKSGKNENLLEVLRKNKIEINNNCGAKEKCGKCKVKILSKNHHIITDSDKKYLSKEEIAHGIRLSCMINLRDDIEIELINNNDDIHILEDSECGNFILNSRIKKKYIEMNKPSLIDQRDDFKRLKDTLNMQDLQIDMKNLQRLTNILEENNYKITVTTYQNKIIHIQGKDRTKYNYGIALNLGSTTIVMYLMDLNNGKIISLLSKVNNQRVYGSDVISRVNYTMENKDGLDKLNNTIINQINEMIDTLATTNNINKDEIYNLVVVGNTVMIHLFMKIPCKNITLSPFIPTFTEKMVIKATDLKININGIISLPECTSAYMGNDISAGILSSKLYFNEKYSLLLSMGTDGEILLGNKDKIFTCSTAAGPVFEGANIKYGIGGVSGAISKVDLSKDNIFETINDKLPCGICGSGVLDITSELLKHEIIDETGRINNKEEIENKFLRDKINEENNVREFVLYKDENKKISFTQRDLHEVQLAKAAICAGIKVLLKEGNISYEQIENVYISGSFGNYMDINSTVNIGMIPLELKDKVKYIGNCAGKGAINYLVNQDSEEYITNFINRCEYIELSKSKDFQALYMDSICF
ncbi:ASKHA domain-containing protein [Terrisporobacter sp.]